MQAGAAPVVADVGVTSRLQEPLGKGQVSVDAGLQQRHAGLRRVVDEDIGHVRVGIRKFQRTCIEEKKQEMCSSIINNLNKVGSFKGTVLGTEDMSGHVRGVRPTERKG